MSAFESLIERSTTKGDDKVHAVVLITVDKNGKDVFSKSSGHISLAPRAPAANADSAFHIASCSKLVTSIAVLQNVERGILDLDEPVNKWVPEFNNIEVLTRSGDEMELSSPASKVTLRQLITHSSGIGYDVFQPSLMEWRQSRGEEGMHTKGPIEVANRTPLLFEPGQGWEYGAGIDWAGLIVARANSTTLEEYMQKNIFEPLDMKETTFHLANRPQLRERLVHIMTRNEKGTLDDIGPTFWPDPAPAEYGGHGLISTPNDYIKILKDIIGPSSKLLEMQTLESMFLPQFYEESAAYKALESNPGVGIGQFPILAPVGQPRNFGLGSFLVPVDLPGVGKTKNTLAWAGFFNWVWFANRDQGIAGLFATHTLPPGEPETVQLVDAFIKESFSKVA